MAGEFDWTRFSFQFFFCYVLHEEKNKKLENLEKSNLLSWSPKSTWGYSTSDIGVGIDLLQGARLEDVEPAKTYNNTETGRLAYEFDEAANITQLLDAGLLEMPEINMKIAKVSSYWISRVLNRWRLGTTGSSGLLGLGSPNQVLSKWTLWVRVCRNSSCRPVDFDRCTVSIWCVSLEAKKRFWVEIQRIWSIWCQKYDSCPWCFHTSRGWRARQV